jgi:hypothetical protein
VRLRNPFVPGFFEINVVVIADFYQQEEHISNIMCETGRTSRMRRTLPLGDQGTFGKNADDSTQFYDERTWVLKYVRPEQFMNALGEIPGIVDYFLKFHRPVGAQSALNSFLRNAANAAILNVVFFNIHTINMPIKEDLCPISSI